MTSALWSNIDGTGERAILIEPYEYRELNFEEQETRFLVIQPCAGDKNALENHVKCKFTFTSLTKESPPSFIAVKNSRGYRKLQEAIELDGKALIVSYALEKFLRHFRRSDEPVTLWIRHICLQEYHKDEKDHYWNRPFIDSMYQRAADVVDMAEFISELRDKGMIEHAVDSRYKSWTKLWDELPKDFALPSVFPIKLGKRPSHDNPTDFYEYVPLDMVADEIRVLVVMESQNPEAPIVTHLAHCPIVCEVKFHGLSWCWGTEVATEEIVVNGMKMNIRRNLAAALRALRRPDAKLAIWIDAICIDQNNIFERNRQLTRMSEIYDRAAVVVCYTGEEDENSDMALDFVQYLQAPMMRVDGSNEWIVDKSGKDRVPSAEVPRRCGALYRFLTRPYFRRVWILQEIASSSTAIVACGNNFEVLLESLDKAAYNLQDMLRRDPSMSQKIVDATPNLPEVSSEELSYVRTVFFFRHLHMGGSQSQRLLFGVKIKETAPGFLETAILSRHFQASDISDKIYALWNLARDKGDFRFKMDYTDSPAEAFSNFTAAWAKHSGSLDIIGTAEPSVESNSFYTNTSSWCTDWSTPSQASCFVRKEHILKLATMFQHDLDGKLYNADGGVKQTLHGAKYFGFDGKILECTGFVVDEIQHITKNEECQHGFWCQCQPLGWLAGAEFFFRQSGTNPYDDAGQALWALVHGDSVVAWPRREDNAGNVDEDCPEERFVCRPDLSRHITRYAGSYSRTDAQEVMGNVTRGRSAFITQKGYLGLIPRYVQETTSLSLAILATCSVPVLLQEQDDGTHKFLGSCFVQGWMDGERINECLDGESPEQFWEAISEVSQLRIT